MNVIRRLQIMVFALFAIVALSAVLFLAGVFTVGYLAGNVKTEFLVYMIMIIVTLCAIPLALRMFHLSLVRHRVQAGYFRWSLLRLLLIGIPLILCVLFYFLFDKVAFAYLAIILLLALCFVFPTRSRIEAECAKMAENA